ncbi:MAG TPA: cyclic nucleotide-binding domain-containing protein [Pseudolabrys sp.]|nr:cyclic nucleotide-binding domain-containing protein [Pseudolabrys sp.]
MGAAVTKYRVPVGGLCTDLPSEHSLKSALSALQRGPIRFMRDHVIACEGESADYVFLVMSGVVRSCKTFQNGERAVVAFYLPGDMFGWGDEIRPLSIEAASDAVVMLIKRKGLATLAETNTQLATFLRTVVTRELERARVHAASINISAKDRFLTFLKDWSKRSGASSTVYLSIGYQDIADYLGFNIETLSRVITRLQKSGVLSRTGSRRTLRLGDFMAVRSRN